MEVNFRSRSWSDLTFAIVGLGLIGGSYGKALRKLNARKIIGIEQNPETLQLALDMGVIDEGWTSANEGLQQADVLICCIYPDGIVPFVAENVKYFNKNLLMTDVAGIKRNMIAQVQALLGPGMEFISGHPMAGRQASGLGMSDAHIFQNANYIIVPEQANSEEAILWLEAFAKALGCRNTVRVTADEHDRTIAYTSNLPHITAVALIDSGTYNEATRYFVAGSFKDGTRVADINPELWSALFMANRMKCADELDKYIAELEIWRRALREGDAETMKERMRLSGARRKELY